MELETLRNFGRKLREKFTVSLDKEINIPSVEFLSYIDNLREGDSVASSGSYPVLPGGYLNRQTYFHYENGSECGYYDVPFPTRKIVVGYFVIKSATNRFYIEDPEEWEE